MNVVYCLFVRAGRWPRPVATPTALSLVVVGGLLVAALLLPDEAFDEASAATGVERVAVTPSRSQQRTVSLRDRLVVGLQARLKSEVEFVEAVVESVHAGRIPQRLVDQTFFWARQRASDPRRGRPRRPIIYFQPAMNARAERLGVEL